jgi:hypothetical protein
MEPPSGRRRIVDARAEESKKFGEVEVTNEGSCVVVELRVSPSQ